MVTSMAHGELLRTAFEGFDHSARPPWPSFSSTSHYSLSLYLPHFLSKTSIVKPLISSLILLFSTLIPSKSLHFLQIHLSFPHFPFSHANSSFGSLSSHPFISIYLLFPLSSSATYILHTFYSHSSFLHSITQNLLHFSIFSLFHTPSSSVVGDFSKSVPISLNLNSRPSMAPKKKLRSIQVAITPG